MADEPKDGQAPLNPDLAGYPTVDALVGGYRASGAEAKRLADENRQLKAERDQIFQAAVNQRPEIHQRPSNPYDRMSELGIPGDAIREAITSEIQNAFQPLQRGVEARNQLLARYPDYTKFESDVAAFVQSDPALNQTYQRMFSADPVGAFEYAFLKFGDSRRRSAHEPDEGGMQETQAHAAIPSARQGDSRRAPDPQAALDAAYRRYQETGNPNDARAYAKLRLRNVISDEFLNQ